jgi:DNA-binding MarR family transcriptional regulator
MIIIRVRKELPVSKEKTKTSASPNNSVNAINNRLFFRLVQCSNLYESGVQQHVNVSSAQGAVLGALSRNADLGMAFADLVEYLAISRQNLDALLKRLEKLDYVERIESPQDRRARIVRMTPKGYTFWTDIFQQSFQFYRKITNGISSDEKKLLTDLLIRIGHNLRKFD